MRFTADYHIHSRYSDGQATLCENVEAALCRGLEAMALTDHGPYHLHSGLRIKKLPGMIRETGEMKQKYASRILVKLGIEANIVGLDGTIDVPKDCMGVFEVIGLGYHLSARGANMGSNAFLHIGRHTMRHENAKKVMTDMLIAAMERYRISFLAHPGLHTGPLDWERLGKACAQKNVAIELSARSGHLCLTSGAVRMMRGLGAVFIVNSDAHRKEDIGDFHSLTGFIEEAGLTHHDIVNAQGYDGKLPFGL